MVKKQTSPLEKASRLLDLVPYIHAHQGISLDELASNFGVTSEELTEDLTTLWMCGLPGYTPLELMDLDFDSGYVSIRNAQTLEKPRSITHEEGVAILLGLDLIRTNIPSEREDLINCIDNLRKRISQSIDLPDSLEIDPAISQALISVIKEALSEKTGLAIEYHSLHRDELSSRKIFPLEIVRENGNFYLYAYCYLANDFRHFRIDRIVSIEKADLASPREVTPAHNSMISATARLLKSSRDTSERFALENPSVNDEFEIKSYSEQWVQRAVLASGDSVELLSPRTIREIIAERAQSILDCYL
jgi:proteasome accessory factor C